MFGQVVKTIFPKNVYPTVEDLREMLRQQMGRTYPDYIESLPPNKFINLFVGEWASPVST